MHYDWCWHFDVSPAALWPFVSNTNHFNRAAGVPPVERVGVPDASGNQRLRLRRFGLIIEWDEEPFEWVKPQRFSVVRRYQRGPIAEMRVQVDLAEARDGTDLRYQVWAEPRNLLGRAAIRLQVGVLSEKAFRRVFGEYAAMAKAAAPASHAAAALDLAVRSTRAQLSAGADARLQAIRERLSATGKRALVDQLIGLIEYGDENTLARLRPYLLADAWNSSRRELVELALNATRAGLLDLQWDLMCPMCRGTKDTVNTLAALPNRVHCDACNIDFTANFEQVVELTFRPSASIRELEVFPFCVGGPQVTPHIITQQRIAPGETRCLDLNLEPGHYRVRAGQAEGARILRVDPTASTHPTISLSDNGWGQGDIIAGRNAAITLANDSAQMRLFIIERTAWNDQALSAAEVTAMQRFRDLFSNEALRAGESISVGSLAVLFTDLRDSTRLYRTIGDATAFGRVLDHFDIVRDALLPERGALVKTIGDAVMAVFRTPAGAVRAILRAQDALAHAPEGVQPPFFKAGAHFGPCIGVTLNDRFDYFGSTVNLAARLDSLARGGEMIVSDAIRFDPEVDSMIGSGLIVVERFEAQLKGFEDIPFSLWRISAANRRWGQC